MRMFKGLNCPKCNQDKVEAKVLEKERTIDAKCSNCGQLFQGRDLTNEPLNLDNIQRFINKLYS